MASLFSNMSVRRTVAGLRRVLQVSGNSGFARIANLTPMEAFRKTKHCAAKLIPGCVTDIKLSTAPIIAALKIAPKETDPEIEEMRIAANSSKLEDQLKAASSMKTPNDLLFELLGKKNDTVALAALDTLRKKSVPEAQIMAAAVDNNEDLNRLPSLGFMLFAVKMANFAMSIGGPAGALSVLSKIVPDDYNAKMLHIAAQSVDTPTPHLFKLVRNVKTHIAKAAIKTLRENKVPESDIMEEAAKGFNDVVIIAARSKNTPNGSLIALLKHANDDISQAAFETLKANGVDNAGLMEHAAQGFNHTQSIAARSDDTPTQSLFKLARHANDRIALDAVAKLRSKGVKEEVLMGWLAEGFNAVQMLAATSKETPIKAQYELIKHANDEISLAAIATLRERGASEENLMDWAADGFNAVALLAANSKETPIKAQYGLIKHANDEIAMAAIRTLRERGTKEENLMEWAASGFNCVQLIAAQSPDTPVASLLELKEHVNDEISSAAAKNLKKRKIKA